MTRTSTGWIALCLLALVQVACTSRTIPLPPPDVPPDGVSAPVNGLVTIRGTAQDGASVGVINEQTMSGVITTSPESGCRRTCPFEAQIEAQAGDHLRIWQFRDTPNPSDRQVPAP